MSVHWDDDEDEGETPDWLERQVPRVMAVFSVALGGSALTFALEGGRWDLACVGLVSLVVAWCFWRETR